MSNVKKPASRRNVLAGVAALAALPLLAEPDAALAAGTLPKTNAKYQDKPNGANRCGKCNYFIAGANPTALGQCKVVAGPISPNGWCTLFAPKHA